MIFISVEPVNGKAVGLQRVENNDKNKTRNQKRKEQM
jgi:hypothetical protein